MTEIEGTARASLERDGILLAQRLIAPEAAAAAADPVAPLFAGHFETGLQPDEWNWREGRDPADDTMDESFFPIPWTEAGGGSGFLEAYLAEG